MSRKQADQDRLDAIHTLPCIACLKEGVNQPSLTEAHHIVDKGYRKHSGGDQATLPLCGWHHRADVRGCQAVCDPPTISNALMVYGPSLEGHKKMFIKTYGSERDLLAEVDSMIGVAA